MVVILEFLEVNCKIDIRNLVLFMSYEFLSFINYIFFWECDWLDYLLCLNCYYKLSGYV